MSVAKEKEKNKIDVLRQKVYMPDCELVGMTEEEGISFTWSHMAQSIAEYLIKNKDELPVCLELEKSIHDFQKALTFEAILIDREELKRLKRIEQRYLDLGGAKHGQSRKITEKES